MPMSNFPNDLVELSTIFDNLKVTGLVDPQVSLRRNANFDGNVLTTVPLMLVDFV